SEKADPADDELAKLAHVEVQRWKWEGPELPRFKLPATATVFLVADPLASPIDQVEALRPWLIAQGRELARIFCCVDCQLAVDAAEDAGELATLRDEPGPERLDLDDGARQRIGHQENRRRRRQFEARQFRAFPLPALHLDMGELGQLVVGGIRLLA